MSDHSLLRSGLRFFELPLLLLTASLMFACVSTDVGNPGDQELTNFQLEFISQDSSTAEPEKTQVTPAEAVPIDSAMLVVSHIDYLHGDTCANPESARLEGPFVIDLMSGAEWPSPSFQEVPVFVCGLEIILAPFTAEELEGPNAEAMSGLSVRLSGLRSGGESFVVSSAKGVRIMMRGDNRVPYRLEPTFSSGFVSFAVEEWLGEADLQLIEGLPESALTITENNRPDLVMRFLAGLRSSAVLIHDVNQDGVLQPAEAMQVIAVP